MGIPIPGKDGLRRGPGWFRSASPVVDGNLETGALSGKFCGIIENPVIAGKRVAVENVFYMNLVNAISLTDFSGIFSPIQFVKPNHIHLIKKACLLCVLSKKMPRFCDFVWNVVAIMGFI